MSTTELIRPQGDAVQIEAFLGVLWPDGLPHSALLTIAAPDGARWTASQYRDLGAAAADLARAPDRYLTMPAMRALRRGRGRASDAVAIACLWADVDTLGGKHAEKRLPTSDAALELLVGLDASPSIILASGGGLYAFWLLEEHWDLTTPEEHALAARVSKAWQARLRSDFTARGWHLDDTSSLAQPLRAPGSLNAKYDPPRMVRVLEPADGSAPRRYSRSRLVELSTTCADSVAARPSRRAPAGTKSTRADWLRVAADALGGTSSTYQDAHGGGIVLRTCPFCRGEESAGTIATGTAHIASKSGDLRCKRASCDAYEGATFGVWIERVETAKRREVRLARARSDAAEATWTDDGNAVRLFEAHGKDVAYLPGVGWIRWDGMRFSNVATSSTGVADGILQLAREVARRLRRPKGTESGDEAKAFDRHRRDSLSERGVRAAVLLARGAFESAACTFDVAPYLLNVRNGTLDLRTREFRRHRREDRLTLVAGAEYRTDARCPDLEGFLADLTGGDVEFLDYVRRVVGYLLEGGNAEDRILLGLGRGGSGKSTFVEALGDMLGDYAGVIPYSALVQRAEPSATRPELLAARGKRLVYASEAPEGLRLDAATLKSMTGGDSLTVRGLYANPTTFRPGWTPILVANHAPRLDPGDTGNRRRLVVLPFDHLPERRDTGLRARLREPDALAALLAFGVRGNAEWKARGELGTCAAVNIATARYWTQGGAATAFDFVQVECERALDDWTQSTTILEAAKAFACERSAVPPSKQELARALEQHGFVAKRHALGNGWLLRLRAHEEV